MKIRTSIAYIEYCKDNGLIDLYATFLSIKYRYSNSCFYAHSLNSIAGKMGYSRNKLRNRIKKMTELGWLREHNGNLIFKKISELQILADIKAKSKVLLTTKTNTIKEVKHLLYYELLKNKKRQCDYIIKAKSDLKNPHTLKEYKRAQRIVGAKNLKGEKINPNFQISFNGLSEVFNNSVSQSRQVIHFLKKEGLLISTQVKRMFAKNIPYEMFRVSDFGKNYYWNRGCIFKVESNIYTLCV